MRKACVYLEQIIITVCLSANEFLHIFLPTIKKTRLSGDFKKVWL